MRVGAGCKRKVIGIHLPERLLRRPTVLCRSDRSSLNLSSRGGKAHEGLCTEMRAVTFLALQEEEHKP